MMLPFTLKYTTMSLLKMNVNGATLKPRTYDKQSYLNYVVLILKAPRQQTYNDISSYTTIFIVI